MLRYMTGQGRAGTPREKKNWLGRKDSNLRMRDPKTRALPLGYSPALGLFTGKVLPDSLRTKAPVAIWFSDPFLLHFCSTKIKFLLRRHFAIDFVVMRELCSQNCMEKQFIVSIADRLIQIGSFAAKQVKL